MIEEMVAFLNARLDEAEATARYAGPAHIAWLTYHGDAGQMFYTTVAADHEDGTWVADGHPLPEPASVRVVYDPARVLREVAAKRAILAAYVKLRQGWDDLLTSEQEYSALELQVLEFAVQAHAAVYSDHPDYRQEWKP